jgi:predicted nucleotidyltransferase
LTATAKNERVVRSLAKRLLEVVGSHIYCIVLFGSTARQDATSDSDIDLLLITDGSQDTKRRIHEVSYDIDLENDVFTHLVFYRAQRFADEVRTRSYFADDILKEGIVLYDDGTLQRIRGEVPPPVARVLAESRPAF